MTDPNGRLNQIGAPETIAAKMTHAFTLATRLATTAAVGTALVGVEAGCCDNPWNSPVDFELDTDADLNAVMRVGVDSLIFATANGELIRASYDPEQDELVLRQDAVEYAGTVPFNAVAHSYVEYAEAFAVGDDGLLLHKIDDGAWETIDLGTSARLLDVQVIADDWVVIAGDGVLFVRELWGNDVWVSPPEPVGGWGELRAVFGDQERIWAVGAEGVAFVSFFSPSGTAAPTTTWRPEDTGLGNVDLNGGGGRIIVGDAGSLSHYDGVRWQAIRTSVDEDLLDYAGGVALGRDGRLFEASPDGLHREDKTEGLNRGLYSDDHGGRGIDFIVVGRGGRGRAFHLDTFCGG